MRYKAQIKTITKVDKPPFADGIYTWEIETTKHKGLYYTSKMSYSVGDEIEYGYIQQKNKAWKLDSIKKIALYNNYSKEQKPEYQARLDTGRSILLQVAFKEASQAYINGKISQDEVEQLTNKFFKIIDK
tara:strand:+ start:179 stop:568 length:390 start_codon:yes stop_codon:yes gene_type:complete